MENLYKYDLQNRFRFHQFNVTPRGSLFDLEILDENETVVRKKTYGDEKSCYIDARIFMGIDSHVPPILRTNERDSLRNCPAGLEIIVEDSNTPPPYHKKFRRWGNEWIDLR